MPSPFDRTAARELARKVLGYPENFPDEFKAWIPRYLSRNPNLTIDAHQLPGYEDVHIVGTTGDVDFTNGSAAVSWGGEVYFFKSTGGIVFVGGGWDGSGLGFDTEILTFPDGYRPSQTGVFPTVNQNAGTWGFGVVTVEPNGQLTFRDGGNDFVSLGGIFFRAA